MKGRDTYEAEDLYLEIPLVGGLFTSVELSPLVNVFAALCTLHGEGCHKADGDDFGASRTQVARCTCDFRRIELRRIVFRQYLSFRHDE